MNGPPIHSDLVRLAARVTLSAALLASASCTESRREPPGAASVAASGAPYEAAGGRIPPTPQTAPLAAVLPPPASCPSGMVPVAGGGFLMGSPVPAHNTPEHAVEVGPFCIGRTEVTVAEYQACTSAKQCSQAQPHVFYVIHDAQESGRPRAPGPYPSDDVFCNVGLPGHGKHPINCVTSGQAEQYCAWKGGRLPTEEEWELAARGRDGRLFPWGNGPSKDQDLGNTCGQACKAHLAKLGEDYPLGNGWPDTAPVGSFPANASPFGALDMVGSVEEWTLGDPCAYRRTPEEASSYAPCGPYARIVRGGSALPAVARFHHNGQSRLPALGFRCVQPG